MGNYYVFDDGKFEKSDDMLEIIQDIKEIQANIVLLKKLDVTINRHIKYNRNYEVPVFSFNNKNVPVIFFGYDSYFQKDHTTKLSTNNIEILWHKIGTPRYYAFFDCCIWCYYISLRDQNLKDSISKIKNEIQFNHSIGLYDLSVSTEFIELQTRLLSNSYLNDQGGHGTNVVPFVFHSESQMRRRSSSLIHPNKEHIYNEFLYLSKFVKSGSIKFKWRILLIDDYANEALRSNESSDRIKIDKLSIIKHVLENEIIDIFEDSDSNSYKQPTKAINLIFDFAESIPEALEKMAENVYDFILLDYLLDTRSDGERNYSHQLLKIIDRILHQTEGYTIENKNEFETNLSITKNSNFVVDKIISGIIKNIGPLGRFWFFNISSFQYAFLDRLREQGLGHNSEYWYLFRGADPLNTPELFKYSIYQLLNLQISEVYFDKKQILEHFEKYFTKASDNIRAWAKSYYQSFISKFGKIHILKTESSSFFSMSFCDYFSKEHAADIIFYEKMRNFLYLLANGSPAESGQLEMSYREISKEIKWESPQDEQRLLEYINTLQ